MRALFFYKVKGKLLTYYMLILGLYILISIVVYIHLIYLPVKLSTVITFYHVSMCCR